MHHHCEIKREMPDLATSTRSTINATLRSHTLRGRIFENLQDIFSPRTDLRLSRPIKIVIEEVLTCSMGLYNEVARACGDQSTKSETSQ